MRMFGAGMTEARETAENRRPTVLSRGVVVIGASLLAVGVFAAGVTVAYQMGLEAGRGQTITIIQAEEGPVKVRPKEPGGMPVPFRDKSIYRQMAKDADNPPPERLLPPAERPIERLLLAVDPPVDSPATVPPADAAPSPVAAKRRADEAEPPGADTGPPPAPKPRPARLADASGGALSPPPPRQVAALPPPPSKGNFVVQLAAARSKDSIRFTWDRIRDRNPDLFRGLKAEFVPRYLGRSKGTWYRLRVGPFADANAARAFCGRAKARKVACIVAAR